MSVDSLLLSSVSITPVNFTTSLNATSALSQVQTNGDSVLGTSAAPNLTDQLPLSDWGLRTADGTDPYTDPPHTGVTRYYDFKIHRSRIAPDGVERDVLLINNKFPGPTIEANWGDTISVNVQNDIDDPDEGTALHWHGLLQKESPWEDGVPGVQQCPIAPGKSLNYSFQADLYGTSWYHSHYSAQYAGGLFGAMIIHGPKSVEYDIDVGPVLLTDWYHKEYFKLVEDAMSTNFTKAITIQSDNNLINGKMNFDCSLITDGTLCVSNAGLSKFQFTKGKKHRLRLINASAEGIQAFSIDNHTLTVVANDFVPVVPYDTKVVTLGVGQRSDVIVEADGDIGSSYWMRSNMTFCSLTKQPLAQAIIYYDQADRELQPTTMAWPNTTLGCANDDLSMTVPFYNITPSPSPATTIPLIINTTINETGNLLWTVNDSSFRANYNSPVLLLAKTGNTSYPYDPEWNVYNTGSNNTIRFIVHNLRAAAHPMHLHGHNMFILAEGVGEWNGEIVHAENPQRRDVQILQPDGYMVVQIDADNPGVWPFHCHIAWHVSQGLYVNILERPDDIKQLDIPRQWADTCNEWADYTNTEVVNQIDSGLKMV